MLINNHDIHIEFYGPAEGHPVVLLHHGLGSIRSWRYQIPALAEAGYRLVAYDRWGYGQSGERPSLAVPSFKDDLADLQAILDRLDASQVTLIGHSDGGTIALYWAALYPQQVSALGTIAAHIYLEAKMEPGIKKIQLAFEHDPRFREGLHRLHGDNYESVFRNWYDGWQTAEAFDWNMRPMLSQVTCPTLVIQGDQDEHATPQHARDISNSITTAELWLVSDANHMLPQEMPNQINTRILKFLLRHT